MINSLLFAGHEIVNLGIIIDYIEYVFIIINGIIDQWFDRELNFIFDLNLM